MEWFRRINSSRNADAIRSIVLIVLAVLTVSAVFWTAGRFVGLDENGALAETFKAAAESSWALPIVIVCFTAASFIGAPQFLLIALAVAAFGPVRGFMFSYVATMISASTNFLVARLFGARWLQRHRGATLKTLTDFVGRNGFYSALIVRIVPSAPFVVVNMGMGMTTMPYMAFLAGTAVGVIPKTTLVALLGKIVQRARAGETDAILYLVLAALVWIVLAYLARWLIRRRTVRPSTSP
jgi:uncharacterized membrane protein YdjX (TVP38/TMEM64 family)